jgi:integrase
LNDLEQTFVYNHSMKIQTITVGRQKMEVICGSAKVTVRQVRNGAYKNYRLDWKVGTRAQRRSITDAEKAVEEARNIVKNLFRAEGEKTLVRSEDIVYYRECQKRLGSVPLHEAVAFYLRFHNVDAPRKTLADIIDDFIEDRKRRELSERYSQSIRYETGIWKKWAGGRTIQSITSEQIDAFFDECGYGPVTKRNLLRTLKALETFASKKRYLPRDFDSALDRVSIPAIRKKTYSVFTPEELMRLFLVLTKDEIAYVATMAFAGARRAELERFAPQKIDLNENLARIDAEIAKKGSARVLDLPTNLKQWLQICELPTEGSLITTKKVANISSDKERLASVGLEWKQNVLRHSFCSYHLALHRNADLTSELAGNSPKMLKEHYKTLVIPSAATAWFSITPTSVREYASQKNLTGLITW